VAGGRRGRRPRSRGRGRPHDEEAARRLRRGLRGFRGAPARGRVRGAAPWRAERSGRRGACGGRRRRVPGADLSDLLLRYEAGGVGEAHVLHTCDNPPGANPAHLYLGDDAANHADMVARGRSNTGDRNPNARLTWEEAAAIRARHAGGEGYRRLARAYGVDLKTIARVVRGEGWRPPKGAAVARLLREQEAR
jgi:hypothetical protein